MSLFLLRRCASTSAAAAASTAAPISRTRRATARQIVAEAAPVAPSVVQAPLVLLKPTAKKSKVDEPVPGSNLLVKAPFLFSMDLGIKKIAYCLYNTIDKRIVEWKRVDLEDAGVNSANVEDVVEYFESFIKANGKLFEMDCHVLIENQVSARLRVVQAIAYTAMRTAASTQIVNPRRVRQHFGISTGVWAKNKKASVIECERRLLLDTAEDESAHWTKELQSNRKQDDLADCFLQALYWRHLLWNEKPSK